MSLRLLRSAVDQIRKSLGLKKIAADYETYEAVGLLRHYTDVLGHAQSCRARVPLDENGAALPWFTYPALFYLQRLDFSAVDIFEFGSGFGSRFWSRRAKSVISVESNVVWYERNRPWPSGLTVHLRTERSAYVGALEEQNKNFGVIVVDGEYRVDCIKAALKHLRNDGLLILDNSDWYPKICEYLRQAGLLQVDFAGFGPVNAYPWVTSLFFCKNCRLQPLAAMPNRYADSPSGPGPHNPDMT